MKGYIFLLCANNYFNLCCDTILIKECNWESSDATQIFWLIVLCVMHIILVYSISYWKSCFGVLSLPCWNFQVFLRGRGGLLFLLTDLLLHYLCSKCLQYFICKAICQHQVRHKGHWNCWSWSYTRISTTSNTF